MGNITSSEDGLFLLNIVETKIILSSSIRKNYIKNTMKQNTIRIVRTSTHTRNGRFDIKLVMITQILNYSMWTFLFIPIIKINRSLFIAHYNLPSTTHQQLLTIRYFPPRITPNPFAVPSIPVYSFTISVLSTFQTWIVPFLWNWKDN